MGIKGCLCVGEGPGPRSPLFQEPVVAGSGLGVPKSGLAGFVTKPGPRSKPLICPSKRLRQIPPQYTDSRRDNVLERNKLESDPVRGTRPGHYQLVFHTVRWDLVMPRRWSVEKPLQVKQPEQQKHLTSETSPWWPVRDSQAI
ncbi:unnamed protein product [Rangifer tarandus platyrhynchus]|uniref:Uncharacterized protein n=2 Tax=Rangifer tarandus platyrhynchus TaxID=3082113 RepID=A0ABN8Y5E9_RANTA|nr:unnamed protein product [Rangifer tarandus platyrhynchus]CAI9695566.1 unnamed protein product [Rangifer tarandus platyrhynchus]